MKKIFIALVAGFVTGVLVMVFVQPLKPRIPEPVKATEKNSFQQVTARLNKGGGVYLYLSTEEVMEALEDRIEGFKELVLRDGDIEETRKNEIESGFDMFNRLITHSGLPEISGAGISTIRLKNRFQHSRLVLHHYPGDNSGLMWNIFKENLHTLDELELLPADTVLAVFSDVRFHYLWQWLKEQVGESGIFPLQKVMVILDTSLKMQGINLDELLASLDDRAGIILTLDPEKKATLPLMQQEEGPGTIEFPAPSLALVMYVKDGRLFWLLKKMLPEIRGLEGMGENAFKLRAPVMPFPFEPVVVQRDNLLVLATNKDAATAIWAAKQGKNRLKDSEMFKELSMDMPVSGNGFRFLSARFTRTLTGLHKKILLAGGDAGRARWETRDFFRPFPEDTTFYSVLQDTGEGYLVTSNHNLSLENYLMIPVALTVEVGWMLFTSGKMAGGSSPPTAAVPGTEAD
jgi:hypothetical protein